MRRRICTEFLETRFIFLGENEEHHESWDKNSSNSIKDVGNKAGLL
jgi:hypothetical protein